MKTIAPQGYAGIPLPDSVTSLLEIVERYGFAVASSIQYAGKTINLLYDGQRCGYINSTVLANGSVLGYHFRWTGKPNNACPPEVADRLLEVFAEKYNCDPGELEIHHGTGSNAGRTNLHIRNPALALRVLLQDIGRQLDEAVVIPKISDRFVEGAVRDVTLQSCERSSQARTVCIAHYGYNCFVCGVNLKTKYCGLPLELIHVHHEEPLASIAGTRETNPIDDLKPVCPNCHAVIHSRTPPYSIQDVRHMLSDASQETR